MNPREPFTERHRAGASDQTRQSGNENSVICGTGAGHAHHQTKVRHQSIVGAEYGCTQVIARGSPAMPGFGTGDVGPDRSGPTARIGHGLHHRCVAALFG